MHYAHCGTKKICMHFAQDNLVSFPFTRFVLCYDALPFPDPSINLIFEYYYQQKIMMNNKSTKFICDDDNWLVKSTRTTTNNKKKEKKKTN